MVPGCGPVPGRHWPGVNHHILYMHREILGLRRGDGLQADHINGNKLDNRRANLRIVTAATNGQNKGKRTGVSSRHRNVSWNSGTGNWMVRLSVAGRRTYLGLFDDEDEAGRVAVAFRAQLMRRSRTLNARPPLTARTTSSPRRHRTACPAIGSTRPGSRCTGDAATPTIPPSRTIVTEGSRSAIGGRRRWLSCISRRHGGTPRRAFLGPNRQRWPILAGNCRWATHGEQRANRRRGRPPVC